jgi:hypothetical protein
MAGVLFLAGQASAATVGRDLATQLTFRSAPGEANRLTLSSTSAGEYRFTDPGARLTAGGGCRSTADVHVVLCPSAAPLQATGFIVELGDGDDTYLRTGARIETPRVKGDARVNGGPGSDQLTGGELEDWLDGDSGPDIVRGGGGDDNLTGSEDTEGVGQGPDRVSGGAGNDVVGGGGGADRLSGDSGDDALFGANGDDRLSGGPGRDCLEAGRGNDRLSGGPANDELEGCSGELGDSGAGRDLIRGGSGIDGVTYVGRPLRRVGFRRVSGGAAPRIKITLDGRANDGPRDGHDNVAGDIERARSVRFPLVQGGRARAAAVADAVRTIYRLSRRGTAGAERGVFAGQATVREGSSRSSPTEVVLATDGFEVCSASAGRAHASRHWSRRRIRRLRANARGRFRTRGRYSAATVRGTRWTVTERCDGTLTSVTEGRLSVRDLRRRRTVTVRRGRSYLARAPG